MRYSVSNSGRIQQMDTCLALATHTADTFGMPEGQEELPRELDADMFDGPDALARRASCYTFSYCRNYLQHSVGLKVPSLVYVAYQAPHAAGSYTSQAIHG